MEDRKLRIAAVGDELLAGLGDPRALGWLGRVLARTPQDGMLLESYALPCPQEGTEGLAARWMDEASRRFSDQAENRLVIGLSGRDIEFGLSTARSRLNLANILDSASLYLFPWQGGQKDTFIRVSPGTVTGRRFKVTAPMTWWTQLSGAAKAAPE